MTYDIVIRGGRIVDGTGSAAFTGDVAVSDGKIAAIGKVSETGTREIAADGLTVTPGFVDIHTHLDAQIGWDPNCTPVSWHGVTTALLGNCGVTFAPVRPTDKELLAGMMETVEDIPRHAILSGLPWSWEDYGGYLDAIETLQPGINIAGLVGHSAVRFYVMGERAVEEQASEAERAEMAAVVARSIDKGAVGFSTNRFAPHKLPDGRSIPGTFADPAELVAIAKVVGPRGALMQAVGADNAVLRTIADAADGRLLFSYGSGGGDLALAEQRRVALETLCEGRDMTAITQVRASGMIYGLQAGLPVRGPSWSRLRRLPTLADRVAALNDAEFYGQLMAEAKANGFKQNLGTPVEKVFYLGSGPTPAYTAGDEMNLCAMAAARGEHWAETFLRLGRETHGKALFTLRMFNSDLGALAHMFKSERCFPSLGDAGAHVTQVMDAGWATFVLSHWVRETGFFTLEDAVRRMTAVPARIMGLKDRGTLAVGQRADLNVLDADTVTEQHPELVNDFPGGAARFIQRATGYKATLVNGVVNVENGEHTGRPRRRRPEAPVLGPLKQALSGGDARDRSRPMLLQNPIVEGCTVYFVRHGQTEWNAQERMVGLTDVPLNDKGREQAVAAGTLLGWLDKQVGALDFIAGPLLRTRQTAEILRATLGLDPMGYRQDERLRELDFGRWEGLTWPQIQQTDPANFQLRQADPWGFPMPGGESHAQVSERVRDVLAAIRRDTVLVSHGGVCRTVLALAAGLPTERPPILAIPQGQILVLRDGRFAWMQSTTEMAFRG